MATPAYARRIATEAETLRRGRDWRQAEERFSLLMDLEPEAPRWPFRRAEALARLGRGEEASKLAARLVALAPAHRDLALATARVFGDSGLAQEAGWLLERIAGESGETAALLAVRARVRRIQRDESGALADCVAALARDPNEARALQEIARLRKRAGDRAARLLEQGRPTSAVATIDRHLALDPGATDLLAIRSSLADAPALPEPDAGTAAPAAPAAPSWLVSARRALSAGRGDIAEMLMAQRENDAGEASPAVLAFTARAALMAGRAEIAAERYRRLAELDPSDDTARRGLARALALSGDVAGAERAYRALAEANPSDVSLRIESARLVERRGDGAAALAAWRGVLELAPGDIEAGIGLVAALDRLDRRKESDAAWKALVKAAPEQPTPLTRLARFALRDGKLKDARRLISRLRKIAPDARDATVLWARLNAAEDRLDAAITTLRKLVSADDGALDLRIELGRLYARAHRWPEAAEEFQRVLRAAPDRMDMSRALAQAWSHMGLPHLAEEMWRVHLNERPTAMIPLLGLVRILVDKSVRGEASVTAEIEGIFNLIRDEHGEKPDAMIEEARFRISHRKWREGLALYQSVLVLEPDRADARRGRAQCWMQLGETDQATTYWREILIRRPNDIEATINLARIARRVGTRGEALEMLGAAQAADPDNERLLAEFIPALAENSRGFSQALAHARRWRRRKPDDLRPLAILTRIAQRRNDLKRAQVFAQRACEVTKESAAALELRLAVEIARDAPREVVRTGGLILLLRPHDVSTSAKVAHALLGLNRVAEAVNVIESAAPREGAGIAAGKVLSRAYYRLGRIEDAVRTLHACVAEAPRDVESWRELVSMLARNDREEEALAVFAQAREALSNEEKLDFQLGRILDRAQFETEAEPHYEAAALADPENAEALEALGDMHRREGALDGALCAFVRARERAPRNLPIAMKAIDTMEAIASLGYDPAGVAKSRPVRPILIPERLYEQLADEIAPNVQRYVAREKSVILINSSLAPGGAERQLTTTIEGLAARRDRVDRIDLFCQSLDPNTRRDFYLPQVEAAGVTPVLPRDAALLADHPLVRRYGEFLSRFPADMPSLKAWMVEFDERRPACVHAWQDLTNLAVVVAAILAGVPRIVLGTRSVRPDNRRRRLRRWMRDAYMAIVDLPRVSIIGNSRNGANDYADWLGVDPRRIGVVYNGYALEEMADAADPAIVAAHRAELGLPEKARVMGGVFRMSEEKRPLLWVEAAAEVARALPDAHFVVCGDGPFFQQMLDLGAQLGIGDRLRLVGSRRDIANWYAMFDTLLLASRHEGLPNVVIEAQNAGVPVVVPRVGGAPEVVDDGRTGFLVPDATARTLAERLVTCLDDARWRKTATREGPRFVRSRFGLDRMIENTLRTYDF